MLLRNPMGLLFALLLTLAGCATLPEKVPKGPESHAIPARAAGVLSELEDKLKPHAGDERSGWKVLDSNEDALRWRLALIDSAATSLDLAYYFWWEDESGQLVMKHVIDAADRGVHVRLLLDDLSTLLEDHRTPNIRDWQAAILNAHPNIELRLFNAFRRRSMIGRGIDFLARMDIMNQRMHNKMLIADNRAVILGGRNIGNEYFGFSGEFNFRDIDILGIGPVARQTSSVFDRFWNSDWVVPVAALKLPADASHVKAEEPRILKSLEGSPVLERFPANRRDWRKEIGALAKSAHVGASRVLTDVPVQGEVRHRMPRAMHDLMASARTELLITNSYVIPDESDIALFKDLRSRGVKVKLLTNSLSSQDVPAVHSHYKRWRKPLLRAGVELYETRDDAQIGPLLADTPPVRAQFVGLHSKAIVVDRKTVFIGSMNLDPRSEELNSEMGVVVDSEALALEMVGIIERDMQPANAWHVTLSKRGGLRWTAEGQTLRRQPARGLWQRTQDMLFMLFPRSLY